MITGDAAMHLVVDKDAFVSHPASTRDSRMPVEQGRIDRRSPHLNRRIVSGAVNAVEDGLFLFGTVAL